MISKADVQKAREKIKDMIHETPLDFSYTFSEMANNSVYLKLENLQKTGSFKVRGAYNKLLSMTENEREKGVIAASAGNHAQGVAYASRLMKIPCTIVMPEGAPLSKVQATRGYGAKVELIGESFNDALDYAQVLQQKTGVSFIHAFDDDAIIAGQGTVGLEILEQLPDVEAVICPIGGGGLIAGIATAIKEKKPEVKIYGIQACACPSAQKSVDEQKPTMIEASPTMADGIAVKKPGERNFATIQKYVDDIYCVEETEIARTMLTLLERSKLLVEGSGACALAALSYHKIPIKEKKVVVLVSGGNVDISFMSKIIEYGLLEGGRYFSFHTLIKDQPGNLQRVLKLLADLEANVLNINQQRVGVKVFPGQTLLQLSLETKDHTHIETVIATLEEHGYKITVVG
ncbi:threonine ammonia-lyase [Salipaludibacillus neizhouensis]|uniref:threonine ammonia-lyase n=1 Tax=Salipaludibacillus neizhouensis TaxID=885475 RepID=A0A3A9K9P6_9BACI|nr:threonine ammonia-lyase [Salipaludibacillus neizhouensis]RKL67490.1 threonine ammonia-lyase [Salipaludibacillus neizhouensis]